MDELTKLQAKYLRLAADFENYKRRSSQEVLDATWGVLAQAMLSVLPLMDDLNEAISHSSADVAKGLQMSRHKMENALANLGLTKIESVGTLFDANLHEAIDGVLQSGLPPGTIIAELRTGYKLEGKTLRASLVKISRPD